MNATTSSGSITPVQNKTVITLIATANIAPRIRSITLSCGSSPDDNTLTFEIRKFAGGAGTGTNTLTPAFNNSLQGTPVCTSKNLYTAEPTYTGNTWTINFNQRQPFRWIAPDDFFCTKATDAGFGVCYKSAASITINIDIDYEE